MLLLLLRVSIDLLDTSVAWITLVSAIIILAAIWKLHKIYNKRACLVPAVGIVIFLTGSCLDLLKEYYEASETIGLLENILTVFGISIFSLGLLIIARQLIEMVTNDPLTGINNKRFLEEILVKEIERSRRTGLPLSLAFLDVDHLKQINDNFGHIAGDQLLQSVASKLKKTVRESDIIARFGGDEFVIVLPHTGINEGMVLLLRIKQAIAGLELPDQCQLEISAGIAQYPNHGGNAEQLLAYASKRMFENRRAKL